ncbi:MAG: transporter substrate-binding domain-containing protein [Gammaproteobacteria bacterium]|nr:transporter substrate-binding domain-containing protein [Gammaproteobacteria bacterium]
MLCPSTLCTAVKRCGLLLAACFWWCLAPVVAAQSVGGVSHLENVFSKLPPPPLRVLLLGGDATPPHRNDALEISILADYARNSGRRIEWVPVFRTRELYTRLVRGDGDLAVGALPSELASNPTIASTHPLATERYQLLGRVENTASSPLELAGMKIGIRLSSPLWTYFEKLRRIVPGLQLNALSSDLDRDAALQLIADGVYDATVLPSTIESDDLGNYPRLKRLFDLTDFQPVGWFLRSDNRELLTSLNEFIERYHAAYFEPVKAPRDFAAIKKRGVLRVITRMDPQNYFIKNGSQAGYEFDLVNAFAHANDLQLQVLVADNDVQLVQWLREGAGDIVTSRLDPKAVHGDPGITFSRSYHHAAYAIVSNRASPLLSEGALQSKTVVAYADSAEYRALKSMEPVPGLKIVAASPRLPRHQLFERLAAGKFDATAVSADDIQRVLEKHPKLSAGVSIPHTFDYRWLVQGSDRNLLEAINRFLRRSYRQGVNAQLAERYFGITPAATRSRERISPFDDLMRDYAERYSFDWRLIAAQMYQESQFDPDAVSKGGAKGLMQMLPTTAKSLGFSNLTDPKTAIHAGVKYLYKLRQGFDEGVPSSEKTWFALAAYNIGVNRVQGARRAAQKMDLDPNRWFGNVETAMLRRARPPDGATADRRYGQAIVYVRDIQSLYGAYRRFSSVATPDIAPPGLPLSGTEPAIGRYLFATTP